MLCKSRLVRATTEAPDCSSVTGMDGEGGSVRVRSDRATSLPVLFLGFMGAIQLADPVIANLALVRATQALHFSPSTQALAASISTLALAATVVPAGVLADKMGRRRMLTVALVVAAAGDLLAAAAPNSLVFLIGRAVAGIGLGAVFTGSFGYVRSVVDRQTLSAAFGVFAGMCSVPLFMLMPMGAALASVNWRAAFLIVPIAALVCAALCARILPDEPALPLPKRAYWGLVALGVGVVLLLLGINGLANSPTAPGTLGPLIVGGLALALFAVVETKVASPTFPMALFKSPLFILGALGGVCWNAASAVVQLLSSNLWQYVADFSPLNASLHQLPLLAFSIVGSLLTGYVIGRGRSSVAVLVVGGLIAVIGLVAAGLFAPQATGPVFLLGLCVVFFGCGVMTVPQGQMFVTEAPKEFYGPVTSSRTFIGQLAYALGLAGGAVVANAVTTSRLVSEGGQTPQAASDELGRFLTGAPTTVAQIDPFYTSGFSAAMYVFAGVVAICTLVMMLLGRQASARIQAHVEAAV